MLHCWIKSILLMTIVAPSYQVLPTPAPTVKSGCNDEPKTNAGRLKKDLFCGYDSSVRPVTHHSNQTSVKMGIFPIGISWMMEERNLVYMHIWVSLSWKDNLLTWDSSKYDGLDEFFTETGNIWTPDITVTDPPQQQSISRQLNCAVTSNGQVSCTKSLNVITFCSINLYHYPHDKHHCRVVFTPRLYSSAELDLNLFDSSGNDMYRMYQDHGIWELHSLKASRNVTQVHSTFQAINIKYSYVIQRKNSNTQIFGTVPGFVMAWMVLSVFWLEVQCSARLILPGLTIICHILIIKWLMETLYASFTNIPVIVVFFRDSLLMAGLALTWSVVARSLCASSSSPYLLYLVSTNLNNSPVIKFLLPQEMILKSGASGDEDESSVVVHRDSVEQQWRVFTILIDRLLFSLCLLSYIYLYLCLVP